MERPRPFSRGRSCKAPQPRTRRCRPGQKHLSELSWNTFPVILLRSTENSRDVSTPSAFGASVDRAVSGGEQWMERGIAEEDDWPGELESSLSRPPRQVLDLPGAGRQNVRGHPPGHESEFRRENAPAWSGSFVRHRDGHHGADTSRCLVATMDRGS